MKTSLLLPFPKNNAAIALFISIIAGSSGLFGQTTAAPASQPAAREQKPADINVTVKATPTERSPTEGSIAVITADTFEQQGVNDMGSAVRYEPLVNAPKAATGSGSIWDGSGYTGYNIRGIEGNRVSLDVDGVPQPDAAPKPDGATLNSFGIGRDFTEIENYRSVEIGSGTTGSTRGTPGLGGGVSFTTKSPSDFLGRTGRPYFLGYKGTYASADESWAHTVTGAVRHGPLQALIIYTHRDGQETDSKGTTQPNPVDWNSDAILGKLVWKNSNGHELEFSLDYLKRNTDIDALNKASTTYVGGVTQDSLNERFTLAATHRFTPVVPLPLFDELVTKLYSQDAVEDDYTVAPNYVSQGVAYRRDLRTKFNNDSFGLNSDATKRTGEQRISYGLSASQVESSRPWTEVRTRLSDNVITQAGTKDRMPEMTTTKFAAYANDEIKFSLGGRRASLTPGLRFESVDSKPGDLSRYVVAVPTVKNEVKRDTESYLTPSLAFTLGLTTNLETYATYKRGVRVPPPVEKYGTYDSFSYTGGASGYAVLGNPDLKKETSDAFEVGLRSEPITGFTFHVAAFYTKYKNYIEYAEQPFDLVTYPTINQLLYRAENVGEAEIYGAEASARFDFGKWNPDAAGFSAQLALGGMNSSATNEETGMKSGLASVGPFKGSLTLAYDAPSKRFGAALTGTRIDGKTPSPDIMADSTAGKFAVPGVTLLDLTVYFRINRSVAINAGVYNLTDEKYWDYYSARGLSNAATAANLSEIERYVQPGINGFVSLNLGF